MSLTEPETQALGSIADGLAGSDPRLASMLTIFTRHPRRGTARPQPRRRYPRLGWQQAMLVLGAVISAALRAEMIGAAAKLARPAEPRMR